MAAKVVVLGAGGMLGRAWTELLDRNGVEYRPLTRRHVDFSTPLSMARLELRNVEVVVNCAAWTDVDGAEAHEGEATRVNAGAVGELASRCSDHGCLLVHYSTDYVFDGFSRTPWPVEAPRAPLSAYGRSKAAGELKILAVMPPHLVVRTSWVYAPWGKNFVRTMARLGRERSMLRVVDDQRGRPTSALHLARTTWALLGRGARGFFHVTDGGECTWFELARAVVAATSPACRVEPCSTEAFPRPAPRPPYSVLDLGKTEAVLGPMPSWEDNLRAVLGRLEG